MNAFMNIRMLSRGNHKGKQGTVCYSFLFSIYVGFRVLSVNYTIYRFGCEHYSCLCLELTMKIIELLYIWNIFFLLM